jgi:hypothetical protein
MTPDIIVESNLLISLEPVRDYVHYIANVGGCVLFRTAVRRELSDLLLLLFTEESMVPVLHWLSRVTECPTYAQWTGVYRPLLPATEPEVVHVTSHPTCAAR